MISGFVFNQDIAKKSIWGILHILVILVLGTAAVKLGVGK